MTNTVLTPSMILRETYAIMHQESNFIMRTNRQYDNRFAQSGARIGQSLDVRLPAKVTVRTGNTMAGQNYVERKVSLPLATIKGVDLNFGQEELTFSIDDFSERVLRPAVSQLTAMVEYDAFSMMNSVPNYAGATTTTVTYNAFQTAGRYVSDNLAPKSNRNFIVDTQTRVDFSTDVKGLFQDSSSIATQYVEGLMGRTGGFDVFENTVIPPFTNGTYAGTPVITTSSSSDTGFDGTGNAYTTTFNLKVDGWSSAYTLNKGTIVTISGVFDVHPETKQSLGYLKRFVVNSTTSGSGAGTISVPVSPAPILSGAYQNVNTSIADNATFTIVGASAQTYGQNLAFHRDAFAFVTADLEDPSQYGAWGARETLDNLSIRIWRQGDIVNGAFPCRLDIAYGFVAVYPEWACRLVHTQT